MDKLFEIFRYCWIALCGISSYLFGGMNGLFIGLVTFVVLDYITGIISAIYNKKLSSSIGFRGILKKAVIFAVVAVAKVVGVDILCVGLVVRDTVIAFYLFNEGVSILENCKAIGLPVPETVLDALKAVKDKFTSKKDSNSADKTEIKDKDKK